MKPGLTCYDSSVQQRITQVSGDHPLVRTPQFAKFRSLLFLIARKLTHLRTSNSYTYVLIIADIHLPPLNSINIYFVLPNEIKRTVNGPNA